MNQALVINLVRRGNLRGYDLINFCNSDPIVTRVCDSAITVSGKTIFDQLIQEDFPGSMRDYDIPAREQYAHLLDGFYIFTGNLYHGPRTIVEGKANRLIISSDKSYALILMQNHTLQHINQNRNIQGPITEDLLNLPIYRDITLTRSTYAYIAMDGSVVPNPNDSSFQYAFGLRRFNEEQIFKSNDTQFIKIYSHMEHSIYLIDVQGRLWFNPGDSSKKYGPQQGLPAMKDADGEGSVFLAHDGTVWALGFPTINPTFSVFRVAGLENITQLIGYTRTEIREPMDDHGYRRQGNQYDWRVIYFLRRDGIVLRITLDLEDYYRQEEFPLPEVVDLDDRVIKLYNTSRWDQLLYARDDGYIILSEMGRRQAFMNGRLRYPGAHQIYYNDYGASYVYLTPGELIE